MSHTRWTAVRQPRAAGIVAAALAVSVIGTAAHAAPIVYNGYDINDAVLSGHGNWAHTYNGTITPGSAFVNNGFAGTTATYNGVGSGTLNDGVIGNSLGASQLFVGAPGAADGTSIDPTIFITLSDAFTVDVIDIYGGDITNNGIPGYLAGLTVTLLKTDFTTVSETFATTPFGAVQSSIGNPVNDRIDLTGTTLDGVAAFAVILSDFTGPDAAPNTFSGIGGWFSITELTLDGDRFIEPGGDVAEPGTLALLAAGAALLLRRRRRA